MAKGLAVFIDIRNSTSIPTKDKLDKYRYLYSQFNTYEATWANNMSLSYKSYAGDGIMLFFKCGQLNDDVIDLFEEIQRKVKHVEDKKGLTIGIGVGYGEYSNEQIPMKDTNGGDFSVATPLSSYIDLAGKASSLAHKNSIHYFAMNIKNANSKIDYSSQLELKELVDGYEGKHNIVTATSSSNKNFRFSFI